MFIHLHTLLLLSLIGSISFAAESKEDWKAKYNRILTGAGKEIVDPEEVKQHMEQLLETIPADIQSYQEHKNTLEFGLEFSRIDESRCTSKGINRYAYTIYFTALNPPTLIPYLDHFQRKLTEFCETVLPKKVSDAAFQVDPESAAKAKALNAILQEKMDQSAREDEDEEVSMRRFVEVALAYMRANKSIPSVGLKFTHSQRTKNMLKFVEAYDATFNFCKFSRDFYEPLALYKAMRKYSSWELDPNTELWIQMGKTCQVFDPDFARFKYELTRTEGISP